MEITFFSFLSGMIWSSAFIVFIYFLRKINKFKPYFGVLALFFLYLCSTLRIFVPFEFVHTIVIESQVIYPKIFSFLFEQTFWGHTGAAWLITFWIIISSYLFARYVIQHCRIMQKAKKMRRCGSREHVILREMKAKTKRHMAVFLVTDNDINVPMGLGVFKKYILLPDRGYTDEELYYILLHEYTHFINKDIIVKLLISIFCIIFWWNPIVYLLKKDLEQTFEIKCDLAVIKNFEASEKKAYLKTIVTSLELAKITAKTPHSATALFCAAKTSLLEERFQMMAQYHLDRKTWIYNTLLGTVFACLVFVSYAFLPQPRFDPPHIEGEFTPENAYLVRIDEEQYALYIDDKFTDELSLQAAEIYIEDGFSVIQED